MKYKIEFTIEEVMVHKKTATIEAKNWDEVKNKIKNKEFEYNSESYDEELHDSKIFSYKRLGF